MEVGLQFKNALQSGLTQLINLITFLYLINTQNVSVIGLYGILKAYQGFSDYCHLGTRFGIDLNLINIHKKEWKQHISLVVTLSSVVLSTSILLLGLIQKDSLIFLFLFGLLPFTYSNNIRIFQRAINEKSKFINYSIIFNISINTAQLFGIIFFGIKGYVYGFVISSFIVAFILFYFEKIGLSVLDFKKLKKLIQDGLKLAILGIFTIYILTGERLFLDKRLGLDFIGKITILITLTSFLMIIPNSVLELSQTTFFSKNSKPSILKKEFINLFKANIIIQSPFLIAIYFVLDDLLTWVYPNNPINNNLLYMLCPLLAFTMSMFTIIFYKQVNFLKQAFIIKVLMYNSILYSLCLYILSTTKYLTLGNFMWIKIIVFASVSYILFSYKKQSLVV